MKAIHWVIPACPACRHTFSMNVSLYFNRALTTSLSAALLAALMWLGAQSRRRGYFADVMSHRGGFELRQLLHPQLQLTAFASCIRGDRF